MGVCSLQSEEIGVIIVDVAELNLMNGNRLKKYQFLNTMEVHYCGNCILG
jgi:hypothetical protein